MKLDLNDVIIEPIMTEKSTMLAGKSQYVFKVNKVANKVMIKEALEKKFGVKIGSVNVSNLKAKARKTRKRTLTYTVGWKKAIVTLKEGEFDFFETIQ
ncbi:MAG: 50S ribosomal protein L23 [Spirochaetae bacterium HGW-Spirochaetae-6]|nr:MAG: 50S ribosomal protein L23 [Spirochaetae bacterium HGW-Spirochaetae-6]